MKLAVIGLWHLGSVTAACAAVAGVTTVGIDADAARVASLTRGDPPLYEPGLTELLRDGIRRGALCFSAEIACVADADVVWVCHDTPVDDDDRADVQSVLNEAEAAFPFLKDGAVVLVSAQLPVGSVAALERAFAPHTGGRTVSFACSPENLRLGKAIAVFQNPGRIIVGVRDARARQVLEPLLAKFCDRLIWMSVESAEMVKHAINGFLALSVTFANELGVICERVGADASEVEAGMRSEPRIGQGAYVRPGPAFAGGTLARDVTALTTIGHGHGLSVPVIEGILASNRAHGDWALHALRRAVSPLAGETIAVLGLTYKPGTSTLRRSSSIALVRTLLREGAHVRAFDPQVSGLPDEFAAVTLAPDMLGAARGARAVVVATEWPEFRKLTADALAGAMQGRIVLDPGRYLDPSIAADKRFSLLSVGRVS
jgi:UDPglucose 6-dehydrogenase